MKIVVCVKFINGEINPFDACALECALRIEGAQVTVVSMAPQSAAAPLTALTRLGISRAILLSDPAFAGSDTLATAYILSLAIKKLAPELILCGRQSIDGDTAQVGPSLSALLGFSLVTNVLDMTVGNGISCETRLGAERAELPALLTVERINTLRFPSIRSKIGRIEIWDGAALGADISRCGLKGSPTRVLKTFESERGRRKCQFISPDELPALIERLKKEERAFTKPKEETNRAARVCAVGRELFEIAQSIGKEVVVIERGDPRAIAEAVKDENIVLWSADLWGRKNAPIAAAILQTGLCADCTRLETDGEKLLMYRPAYSGNITAKIACKTVPQMATVRIKDQSPGIIVSCGKGAADNMDAAAAFAEKIGAQLGASRAAVDMGLADYDRQIGLTGRSVSPKIYIAIGISGAVHHTCAIEGAQTVIAVNPDKNARIFDYADYGILAEADYFKT